MKPKPQRKRKCNVLDGKLKPGQTPQEASARLIAAGLGANAWAAWEWSRSPFGNVEENVDLTALLNGIVDAAERVNRGDLGDQEAILTAQIVGLNALFVTLAGMAHRAKLLDPFERYLRLAFKAQSQCRATCEALAMLKNPPIFAKQANLASQQVVNNGTIAGASRAREIGSPPSKLLEAHGERLDVGASYSAGAGHPALAPVGTLDRPSDGKGEGEFVPQRIQGRATTIPARVGPSAVEDGRAAGGGHVPVAARPPRRRRP